MFFKWMKKEEQDFPHIKRFLINLFNLALFSLNKLSWCYMGKNYLTHVYQRNKINTHQKNCFSPLNYMVT